MLVTRMYTCGTLLARGCFTHWPLESSLTALVDIILSFVFNFRIIFPLPRSDATTLLTHAHHTPVRSEKQSGLCDPPAM